MVRLKTDNFGNIVIVGCGLLGSMLANKLSHAGSQVVIIDRKDSSFALLDAGFSGFRVTGNAVELEVLRSAGLKEAHYLLATTEKDTVNLMVAQVAKVVFAVPRVVARVYDFKREVLYRQFGIETISPTSMMAGEFLRVISGEGDRM